LQGARQQSTKRASGRNNSVNDCDSNGNSDGNVIGKGDSNDKDADADNLTARDHTAASAFSVGGRENEKKIGLKNNMLHCHGLPPP
jgi:hypothetical protein